MYRTEEYSQHSSIIWPIWRNGWVFVCEVNGYGFKSRWRQWNFRYCARLSKGFLDIQATIECGFALICVRDMMRTYYQMHHTNKYSQHSSVIFWVWLNSWVFVYELSGYGFESRCSHLNFRYWACFGQGLPWHSGNYRVWIHSKTRTWHDKKIQSNAWYR